MSYTNTVKRIAHIFDAQGEYLGAKGFSKTALNFEYEDGLYNTPNCFKEKITYSYVKRWYWDIEIYFYTYGNPNPWILDKTGEPIYDAKAYNIQMNSKVLKDLNEPSDFMSGTNLKIMAVVIILGAIGYILYTKYMVKK